MSFPFKADDSDETVVEDMAPFLENKSCPLKRRDSGMTALMTRFMKQKSVSDDKRSDNSELKGLIPSLKILLVDDSILIQKTTARSLRKAGHAVEVAQHGSECLKMLELSQLAPSVFAFDLILMDLQMPVMDGYEATRRIRALEQSAGEDSSPHILIIGVTANTESEARAECMESGMDGFMEKPLRVKEFEDYLANTLHFGALA